MKKPPVAMLLDDPIVGASALCGPQHRGAKPLTANDMIDRRTDHSGRPEHPGRSHRDLQAIPADPLQKTAARRPDVGVGIAQIWAVYFGLKADQRDCMQGDK